MATQSNDRTVPEFWLMVWEQKVTTIFAIAPDDEHGSKWEKYWHDERFDNGICLNSISVDENIADGVIVSMFELTDGKTNRLITHIRSNFWVDLTAPCRYHFNDLLEIVNQYWDGENPLVIHCRFVYTGVIDI